MHSLLRWSNAARCRSTVSINWVMKKVRGCAKHYFQGTTFVKSIRFNSAPLHDRIFLVSQEFMQCLCPVQSWILCEHVGYLFSWFCRYKMFIRRFNDGHHLACKSSGSCEGGAVESTGGKRRLGRCLWYSNVLLNSRKHWICAECSVIWTKFRRSEWIFGKVAELMSTCCQSRCALSVIPTEHPSRWVFCNLFLLRTFWVFDHNSDLHMKVSRNFGYVVYDPGQIN